jgi:uncharacterized protein YeaO (DUF488 family)
LWQKEIAPSNSLRRSFSHDERKWDEFKARYFKEPEKNAEFDSTIVDRAKEEPITLLYGAKEEKFNTAIMNRQSL